jgi:hypothetical protein
MYVDLRINLVLWPSLLAIALKFCVTIKTVVLNKLQCLNRTPLCVPSWHIGMLYTLQLI